MTNTATLLNGERFGSWVKTSLMAQTLGIPAPKQPEFQGLNSVNLPRLGKRGGRRHSGRGAPSKKKDIAGPENNCAVLKIKDRIHITAYIYMII